MRQMERMENCGSPEGKLSLECGQNWETVLLFVGGQWWTACVTGGNKKSRGAEE